ncbi:MAG: NAD(P)H-hydrate dehydratase [Desulfatibacillaceae bacterium]
MIAIVGTVPRDDFPLTEGEVVPDGEELAVDGRRVSVNRGTPALAAAAALALDYLGRPRLHAFLVGDTGRGKGSRRLYQHLESVLPARSYEALAFHYLQPDVDWHNRVLFSVDAMAVRPLLLADAGFMYAAKMSGQAGRYDVFTPDAGELAFLADEQAPHPFYTRGFILHEDNRVPDLVRRAYEHGNAARLLVVKGATDHVADEHGVLASCGEPSHEAMEAVGGTGDSLTGLVVALAGSGFPLVDAARIAIHANRLAGEKAQPTPASRIAEIIRHIPAALGEALARHEPGGVRH